MTLLEVYLTDLESFMREVPPCRGNVVRVHAMHRNARNPDVGQLGVVQLVLAGLNYDGSDDSQDALFMLIKRSGVRYLGTSDLQAVNPFGQSQLDAYHQGGRLLTKYLEKAGYNVRSGCYAQSIDPTQTVEGDFEVLEWMQFNDSKGSRWRVKLVHPDPLQIECVQPAAETDLLTGEFEIQSDLLANGSELEEHSESGEHNAEKTSTP